MNKPTLTEIKKSIELNGGSYTKSGVKLNGEDAYHVSGELMQKSVMIERYLRGEL